MATGTIGHRALTIIDSVLLLLKTIFINLNGLKPLRPLSPSGWMPVVTLCPLWLYCGSACVRLSLWPLADCCRERRRGFSVVYSREVYSLEECSRDDLYSRECWRGIVDVAAMQCVRCQTKAVVRYMSLRRWSVSKRAQQVHTAQLRRLSRRKLGTYTETIQDTGWVSQTCLDRVCSGSSWRWTFNSLLLIREGPNRGVHRWHLSIRARRCCIGPGEHSLARVYSPNIAVLQHNATTCAAESASPRCSIRCRCVPLPGQLPACLFRKRARHQALLRCLMALGLELNLVLERTRCDVTAARRVRLRRLRKFRVWPLQTLRLHFAAGGCRHLAGRIRRPSFRRRSAKDAVALGQPAACQQILQTKPSK